MNLKQFTIIILKEFGRFYCGRQYEWQEKERAARSNELIDQLSEDDLVAIRISQAFPFAEIDCYKTCDIYDTLQDIFDNNLIEEHRMFAAFLLNNRGIPGTELIEKPELSDALIQWLFRHKKSFEHYDFSFANFEEAYKEAHWHDFIERHMMLR